MKRVALCTLCAFSLMALPLRAADPPPVFPADGATFPGTDTSAVRKIVVQVDPARGNSCELPNNSTPKGWCEEQPGPIQWFPCETDDCNGRRFTFWFIPIRHVGGWQQTCAAFMKLCAQKLLSYGANRVPEYTIPLQPSPPAVEGQCKLPVIPFARVTQEGPPKPPATTMPPKPQHQVCGCKPKRTQVIYPPFGGR